MRRRGFVTTDDGRSLRAAAPAGNADDPVIYVFGAGADLKFVNRAAFSDDAEAQIENALP